LPDINVRESIAIAPLIGMIFIIGFFPNLFLNKMGPSVDAVLDRYREHRQEFTSQENGSEARLLGRRGGLLETGYPEAKPAEGTAQAAPATGEEKAQ
jgi:NADH-quinone oxidoreductase subunit M